MLRILHMATDGSVIENRDPGEAPLPEGAFRWLDLCGASEQELDSVARVFGFHTTAVDDCRRFDQRPKLEPYDDHLFVVIHRLICTSHPPAARGAELHAFIGQRYLVTVH